MTIIKLILAICPAILIIFFVLSANIYKNENFAISRRIISAGFLIFIFSALVNSMIYSYTVIDIYSPDLLHRAFAYFTRIAIHEEFFKLFFLLVLIIFPYKNVEEKQNVILFSLTVGAVFASLEGLTYTYFSDFSLLLRLFTYFPFHILNFSLTIYLLKIKSNKFSLYRLLIAWIIPTLTHTGFKFLMSIQYGFWFIFSSVVMTGGLILLILYFKKKFFTGTMAPVYK
jgi:protease prsW family protein